MRQAQPSKPRSRSEQWRAPLVGASIPRGCCFRSASSRRRESQHHQHHLTWPGTLQGTQEAETSSASYPSSGRAMTHPRSCSRTPPMHNARTGTAGEGCGAGLRVSISGDISRQTGSRSPPGTDPRMRVGPFSRAGSGQQGGADGAGYASAPPAIPPPEAGPLGSRYHAKDRRRNAQPYSLYRQGPVSLNFPCAFRAHLNWPLRMNACQSFCRVSRSGRSRLSRRCFSTSRPASWRRASRNFRNAAVRFASLSR